MKKQTNHKLPLSMVAELKAVSEETGVPQSEMVRRAIRAYLDEIKSEHGKRARRRAPVH